MSTCGANGGHFVASPNGSPPSPPDRMPDPDTAPRIMRDWIVILVRELASLEPHDYPTLIRSASRRLKLGT